MSGSAEKPRSPGPRPIRRVVARLISAVSYLVFLALVVVAFDVLVLHDLLGFGYPRHYEQENVLRHPAPFVEFTGRPDVAGHDRSGFPGPPLDEAGPDDLRVAFFAGSTGYNGRPTIPQIVELELERLLGGGVLVSNFSVVSSNHRQHLHSIVEYLPGTGPDIVVFYGGYNETIQNARYDPRPGYPYNFFLRAEAGPMARLVLEHSAVGGELDLRTGWISGVEALRRQEQPFSDDWNDRIFRKYTRTLEAARRITAGLESKRFERSVFLAFYQPYQVPEEFAATHTRIGHWIAEATWAFDVSSELDGMTAPVFTDAVHVRQEARAVMGTRIAHLVADVVLSSGGHRGGQSPPERIQR